MTKKITNPGLLGAANKSKKKNPIKPQKKKKPAANNPYKKIGSRKTK